MATVPRRWSDFSAVGAPAPAAPRFSPLCCGRSYIGHVGLCLEENNHDEFESSQSRSPWSRVGGCGRARRFRRFRPEPRAGAGRGGAALPMPDVKALVFDTFGTVVDWRNGVARETSVF
jgi:hypothetical protein